VNPFNAIAEIVLGYMKGRALQAWARLLFEMFFSAVVSFLFVAGTLLATTRDWAIAIGTGMVTASVFATILFRRDPLTKGMVVAIPGEEAKAEINSNVQIIDKEKSP
jgi:hypothetical protein